MRDDIAASRYLQRHIEPHLPALPAGAGPWDNVMVIPAHREHPRFIERLPSAFAAQSSVLVILVLNRPDSDSDTSANQALRTAVEPGACMALSPTIDLYTWDTESDLGPLPRTQGVGLARKAGCDLAYRWMHDGSINSRWIGNTDADALLPADYFQRLEALPDACAAAVFPFRHTDGADAAVNLATALYELRLHHYVLGLEYAASPYAMHTLGSCVAVSARHYAQVRGYPQRAGAEDFYLLNKLAKVGSISRLAGRCIQLDARHSNRVPFGTGPAVETLTGGQDPHRAPLFYHPATFTALRSLLGSVQKLHGASMTQLTEVLADRGLDPALLRQTRAALTAMDIESGLRHCTRQSAGRDAFARHFHQWFDGFRTLKFLHYLRDAGFAPLSWQSLEKNLPDWWPSPASDSQSMDDLRKAAWMHWRWQPGA